MISALFLSSFLSLGPATVTANLQPPYQQVVQIWLKKHPGYRLAVDSDCGECTDQIQSVQQEMSEGGKGVSEYHPYTVVGDFNSDGQTDLAIVVVAPINSAKRFKILVFNGPFRASHFHQPAFVSEFTDMKGQGLFFGGPRPKPFRLLVGGFESEGILLVPKGKGYVWDMSSNDY
jgi:hypothetical protein